MQRRLSIWVQVRSVDGRTVTKEILEQKIAETIALSPVAYGNEHAEVTGQEECCGDHRGGRLSCGKKKNYGFCLSNR